MASLSRRTLLKGGAAASAAALAKLATSVAAAPPARQAPGETPTAEEFTTALNVLTKTTPYGVYLDTHPGASPAAEPLSMEELYAMGEPTIAAAEADPTRYRKMLENLDATWMNVLLSDPTQFPFLSLLATHLTDDFIPYRTIRRGVTHQFQVMGDRNGAQYDPVMMETHDGAAEFMATMERDFLWASREAGDGWDGVLAQMQGLARPQARAIDGHRNGLFDARELDASDPLTDAAGRVVNAMWRDEGENAEPGALHIVTTPRQIALRAPADGSTYTHLAVMNGALPIAPSLFLDRVDTGHPTNVGQWENPVAPAPPSPLPRLGALPQYAKEDGAWYYASAIGPTGDESFAVPLGRYGLPNARAFQQTFIVFNPSPSGPSHWNGGAVRYAIYRNDHEDKVETAGIIGYAQAPWPNMTTVWFVDKGAWLPNTDMAVIFPVKGDELRWEAQGPLTKIPLYVATTTIEFLLYRRMRPVVADATHLFVVANLPRPADDRVNPQRHVAQSYNTSYVPRGHFYQREFRLNRPTDH